MAPEPEGWKEFGERDTARGTARDVEAVSGPRPRVSPEGSVVTEPTDSLAVSEVPFLPFSGVRVLDAAGWVAGPFCAQMLRWLGASVDRVEPEGGDPLLAMAIPQPGAAGTARCLYDDANRGKRRVDGPYAATVLRLLSEADVLVCDWTPARQRELGLDLTEVGRRFPRLVVAAVTGYGLTGPAADRQASELVVYQAGGEGAVLPSESVARLFPDRPPVRAGRFLADHDAGLTAAVGVAAALLGRTGHGRGELVDVAATEVEIGLNRTTLSRSFFERRDYDRTYRGYDYSGNLRCTDGWVAVRPVEEPHWVAMCHEFGLDRLVDNPRFADRQVRYENADELTPQLEQYTRDRSRAQVRAALLRAGCPGGPFLAPAEIIADPAIGSRQLLGPVDGGGVAPVRAFHGRWAGPGPGAAVSRPAPVPGPLPLSGLRVIDLTWVAAGPYATELLGFLGAEVVKVESRSRPDLFRRPQDGSDDLDSNIRFMDLNQAKRSVQVDLKDPVQHRRLLELVETADVLVENYRPGVRDRLGLSDADLLAVNPSLVIVALSGFGTAALDADRPGFASIFNAEGGLGWMTGYPDAVPSDVRDTNDLRSGTNAALAAISGLYGVAHGAAGAVLDVAARDTVVILQGDLLLQASRGGTPIRDANALDCAVPYGCWRGGDGRWAAISVRTDQEWTALARLIGADPALTLSQRLQQRKTLDRAVATWAAGRSAAALVDACVAAGVPAGLSAAGSDLLADPQLAARGLLRRVEHPRLGTITLVGPPLRLGSAGPVEIARPPLLGEHDAVVFATVPR